MKSIACIIFVLFVVSVSVSVEAGCKVSDFQILNDSYRTDSGRVVITGFIRNNCSEAAGVEVQAALYGQGQKVLDVHTEWPASINNIPPRSDFPFKMTLPSMPGIESYSVTPVGTNRW